MSVNKIFLIGRLGKDPEYKVIQDPNGENKSFCKFTFATNQVWYTQSKERKTKTTWHDVVCWGFVAKLAEEHLFKGREIHIEGKQENEVYETENGEKRKNSFVVANRITFIGAKHETSQDDNSEVETNFNSENYVSDDIPF